MGSRYDNYGMRGGMGYKDDEWMDEDEMHERRGRRRDSMGRYRYCLKLWGGETRPF